MFNKIDNRNLDFDLTGSGLNNDPEYSRVINAIKECDQITKTALVQFSKIDSSIRQYLNDIKKTSEGVSKYANTLMNASSGIKDSNTSNVLGFAALGLEVAGTVIDVFGKRSARKKIKAAEEERNQKLELALNKKQEIAYEKLGPLLDYRKKYQEVVVSKVQQLYDKDFMEMAPSDETLLNLKVRLFKRDLGILVKSRFLLSTLDYLISEMTAWTKGKNDSKFKKQSFITILENELKSWPNKCGYNNGWDEFVSFYLSSSTDVIPICIATLFSDPVLLCNYVGINIYPFSTCPAGLIVSTKEGLEAPQTPAYSIIENNPYYIDCKHNLDSNFNPPKYPKGIGIGDIIIIVAPIILAFFITYFAFVYLSSWPLRITAIVVSAAVVYISACLDLPVDKRYSDYSKKYDEMKNTIIQREHTYRKNNRIIKI